jgi:hypothetical protein
MCPITEAVDVPAKTGSRNQATNGWADLHARAREQTAIVFSGLGHLDRDGQIELEEAIEAWKLQEPRRDHPGAWNRP